jgi:hypothetical protein
MNGFCRRDFLSLVLGTACGGLWLNVVVCVRVCAVRCLIVCSLEFRRLVGDGPMFSHKLHGIV